MTGRCLTAVAVLAVLLFGPSVVVGQTAAAADDWTPAMTPWGDPDLRGIWNSKTTTPLERPDEFEGREFLDEEEVAALEGRALDRLLEGSGAILLPERSERGTAIDVAGAYNSVFSSRGTTVVRTKRTSLIVDPTDGKIPYSPEGLDHVETEVAYRRALSAADLRTVVDMANGPEDRPNDRCLCLASRCRARATIVRLLASPRARGWSRSTTKPGTLAAPIAPFHSTTVRTYPRTSVSGTETLSATGKARRSSSTRRTLRIVAAFRGHQRRSVSGATARPSILWNDSPVSHRT